jgi:hypothetical protein
MCTKILNIQLHDKSEAHIECKFSAGKRSKVARRYNACIRIRNEV